MLTKLICAFACLAVQLIITSMSHADSRQWHIAGKVNTEGDRAGIKVSGHPFGPEVTTNGSGAFELIWRNSAVHTEAIVVARHPDGKRMDAVLLTESQKTDVKLSLQPGRRIHGRVAVGDSAAEGVNVQVSVCGKRYVSEVPGLMAATGPTGEFEIIAPRNLELVLRFEKAGHSQTERRVQAGGDVVVPDVALRVCRLSISGRVTTASGKPVSGAPVIARGDGAQDQAQRYTDTDDKGEFTIDGLCSGAVIVTVYSPTSGSGLATVRRQIPVDTIDIVVPDE